MDGSSAGAGSFLDSLGMVEWLVIVVLALAVPAVLHFLFRRSDRLDAETLQRLAGKRGWRIERKLASQAGSAGGVGGGRGYRIEVFPTDGAGWSCLVTRYQNSGAGGAVRKTEFEDPGARLPAGMVVVGPGIPEKEAAAAAMLFGRFDGALGQLLLSKLLGDEAASAAGLQQATDGAVPGATVFATPDAPASAIGATYAPLLRSWLRAHPKEEEFPILIAGPERLRIRLRTATHRADQLEAFLDHALETRRQLLVPAAPKTGSSAT